MKLTVEEKREEKRREERNNETKGRRDNEGRLANLLFFFSGALAALLALGVLSVRRRRKEGRLLSLSLCVF